MKGEFFLVIMHNLCIQIINVNSKEKPILGLECKREEESGKRFWGLVEELCTQPENFFNQCFIMNFCPLAFLNKNKNITPNEIKVCKSLLNHPLPKLRVDKMANLHKVKKKD